MCNTTLPKSHGLGLEAVNEVLKRIISMLGDLFVFFSGGFAIYCVVWFSDVSAKCQICIWQCFPPVAAKYFLLIYV